MLLENPFAEFRKECKKALRHAIKSTLSDVTIEGLSLEKPPNSNFGQLASSLCFQLAQRVHQNPVGLAKRLVFSMSNLDLNLIKKVIPAGGGYVNFHVNFPKFSALTLNSIRHLGLRYGFIRTKNPKKIIIEHTSVNPLHPIHIGQARNPILGDSLARILTARGHKVARHYYIDDVGRQSCVVAYGYNKLGRPLPQEKPDHFIGKVYTITSCLVEINRLKKTLEITEPRSSHNDVARINKSISEWVSIAQELEAQLPDLFQKLLTKINEDIDPEEEVNKLNRAYETGTSEAKELIRTVSELCLQGFRETQRRIGVTYDSWDWESDFVWSGEVNKFLQKLQKSPYVYSEAGVLKFDAEKVIQESGIKSDLNLKEDHVIPSLTLVRADGTTLYTTRDIAYTLWKFERAEKVINVIGMEQSLAQLQLKIALHALGYANCANNFIHFAYNLVTLPGYKMSSRRGRYITFDEAIDEAVERAYKEVSKRSPHLSEQERRQIADFVGKGATRYALLDVDAAKPVVFTWDRVLNFETNSAPYVQYTHARACSILRKAKETMEEPAFDLLKSTIEHELVLSLSSFPEVFVEANEFLKPNQIADFINVLSDKFNTFYNALPVLKAEPIELSAARIALTDSVRIVLRNALHLIGIVAPKRM